MNAVTSFGDKLFIVAFMILVTSCGPILIPKTPQEKFPIQAQKSEFILELPYKPFFDHKEEFSNKDLLRLKMNKIEMKYFKRSFFCWFNLLILNTVRKIYI